RCDLHPFPTRRSSDLQYYGILEQGKAIRLAAVRADYILCVYRPVNENNVYASPNKIFDAIQAGIPLIINREVNVAEWVFRNRLRSEEHTSELQSRENL